MRWASGKRRQNPEAWHTARFSVFFYCFFTVFQKMLGFGKNALNLRSLTPRRRALFLKFCFFCIYFLYISDFVDFARLRQTCTKTAKPNHFQPHPRRDVFFLFFLFFFVPFCWASAFWCIFAEAQPRYTQRD